MFCQNAQQARHLRDLLDLRDIANVALKDRLYIICIPVLSAAQGFATQCLGISACPNRSHQVVANDWLSRFSFVSEGVHQKAATCYSDFALGERQQPDDLHASCERICHAWQRHEIG